MPRRDHATPAELIRFANRIRKAGGGSAIDALFPARPANGKECLIAQALNFDCRISPGEGVYPDGEDKWHIYVDDRDVAEKIAAELRRKVNDTGCGPRYAVLLPRRIGRAAEAYDAFNNSSFSLGQIDPMFLPYITRHKLYEVRRGLREAGACAYRPTVPTALAAVEAEVERRRALDA